MLCNGLPDVVRPTYMLYVASEAYIELTGKAERTAAIPAFLLRALGSRDVGLKGGEIPRG